MCCCRLLAASARLPISLLHRVLHVYPTQRRCPLTASQHLPRFGPVCTLKIQADRYRHPTQLNSSLLTKGSRMAKGNTVHKNKSNDQSE